MVDKLGNIAKHASGQQDIKSHLCTEGILNEVQTLTDLPISVQ
jgi:hypothetical protein